MVGAQDVLHRRAARGNTGDDQPLTEWLRLECPGLNEQQRHRVVSQFAAEKHGVLTRGTLEALPEEAVAEILSTLPTGVRALVAEAATLLRGLHADAHKHSDSLDGATAHPGDSGDTSSQEGRSLGAQQWRWWAWPHVFDGDVQPTAAVFTKARKARGTGKEDEKNHKRKHHSKHHGRPGHH